MIKSLVDFIPLWGVLIITIVLVCVFVELGYRVGCWRATSPGFDNEVPVPSVTAAHLALLAFFLAFTFNMAASHFDDRRKVILKEVNAIETAYLRTKLIDKNLGEKLRTLLTEYTVSRTLPTDPKEIDVYAIIAKSEALQSQIWQQIQVLGTADQLTVMDSLMVQAINDMFDINEERIAAGVRNHIPSSIWAVLYAILVLSMFGMGYYAGINRRRTSIPSAALVLSFSLVIFLIADLDRPQSGLVHPDQSSMKDLYRRLDPDPARED